MGYNKFKIKKDDLMRGCSNLQIRMIDFGPNVRKGMGTFLFGYIKPYKPELKMIEYDTYKAVYCGLCKQLGKAFGPFSRMTLSYDFAFLSLLSLGVAEECRGFKRESCAANPLKKKPCLCACEDSAFSASAAMLMLYYKVKDNYQDGGVGDKIKAVLLMPFAGHARKKAKKQYPQMEQIIASQMERQRKLEQEGCSVDAAAEPSARALSGITELIPTDETNRRVLSRVGYLVGRWVYLIDALDDIEEDLKQGCFNPYLSKFGITQQDADLSKAKEYAVGMIHLTAGELSNTYELLEIKRYKTILDNIIYLGLRNTLEQVLSGETKRKNGKEQEL